MSSRYKTSPEGRAYFATLTIIDWIDLFTRREYGEFIVENLRHCIHKKNLSIWAYCLMPSHLHLLAGMPPGKSLSDFFRDFKGFTSKRLFQMIQEHPQESRREWMLDRFQWRGNQIKQGFRLWQEGSHPIEITSEGLALRARDYIHLNPVKAGLVTAAEYYPFSSACPQQTLPLSQW